MGRTEQFTLDIRPLPQSPRKVFVYLPDGYDESRERYPVLYMFDGHNLFDDETATYGKSWGIRDYLDRTHLPLAVIGVDCNHTGNLRLSEYCPYEVPENSWIAPLEPQGRFTAKWFAEKLKPACEKRYRIQRSRRQVGIAGSSMGGLMSMYCIAAYNEIYSRAACVSSTMDINLQALLDLIGSCRFRPDTRIYMDFGSQEVKRKQSFAAAVDNMLQLNHAFSMRGCSTYPNVVVGGSHSEASWENIVPVFLEYLFPELYAGNQPE